ncbi:MAG: hypothetical protein ACP5OA_04435 [Candidatus Woesearchaeota archaeon]
MAAQDIPIQGEGSIEQRIANTTNQPQDSNDTRTDERTQVASIISDLDRRLRILEERYGNLRKKIQLTDQNLIESERSFGKELRTFNTELLELKRNVVDFDDKASIFSGEMNNMAQKMDLKVIEKYLLLWSPEMFVTRRELKEYLDSKKN